MASRSVSGMFNRFSISHPVSVSSAFEIAVHCLVASEVYSQALPIGGSRVYAITVPKRIPDGVVKLNSTGKLELMHRWVSQEHMVAVFAAACSDTATKGEPAAT